MSLEDPQTGAAHAPESPSAPTAQALPPTRRNAVPWGIFALALLVRLLAALFGGARVPPVADGAFYHVVAERIADGQGYTWLWPDGVVTHAAHYPVGYPALMGALYWAFGAAPVVAMLGNALLGAIAAWATYRIVQRGHSAQAAALSGLAAALNPSLIFYTTALMTEGVVAALTTLAVYFATKRQGRILGGPTLGLVLTLGAATLIRPQSVLLAPVFGLLLAQETTRRSAAGPPARRWGRSLPIVALISLGTVACCLPWTIRNCQRMDRCVFVSANAGWNLLIGTAQDSGGGWVPLEKLGVPEQCREVFEEAAKDACFRDAAAGVIQADPWRWAGLVPRKLGATFDYPAAAASYLEQADGSLRGFARALGVVELIVFRVLLIAALGYAALAPGPRGRLRRGLLAPLLLSVALPWASVAILGIGLLVLLHGMRLLAQPVLAWLFWMLVTTALMHSVFFGGGRYALVVAYALCAAVGPCVDGLRDLEMPKNSGEFRRLMGFRRLIGSCLRAAQK